MFTGYRLQSQDAFPTDTILIAAVGDIMLGTDYPSEAYLPPEGDCHFLFDEVREYLIRGDLTFGNLEGTFAGPYGQAKQGRHCYAFRMPVRFAPCLSQAGFDFFSLANNHALDFGIAGYRNTLRVLNQIGIQGLGLKDAPATIIRINDINIGFCAFSYNPALCDFRDAKLVKNVIRSLSEGTDIVIVSFHGGAEGAKYRHVPRHTEYYLGEDRGDVHTFAHTAIDAGADLVLGHGPHVLRAVELYKNKFIAYSLGNFCTYGRFNLGHFNGTSLILYITLSSRGDFLIGKIIPVYQEVPGIPKIDSRNRAISQIRNLTRKDFPDTDLEILDNGDILKRNLNSDGTMIRSRDF